MAKLKNIEIEDVYLKIPTHKDPKHLGNIEKSPEEETSPSFRTWLRQIMVK